MLMITWGLFLPAVVILPFFVMLPLLILGFVIWFYYIMIAFNSKLTNVRWVWIYSVVWNVIALGIWIAVRLASENFNYVTEYHPLIHSISAILFSLVAIALIAPDTEENRDAQ